MNKITFHKDPTLDLFIHIEDIESCLSPEDFVDKITDVLNNFDDTCVKHNCIVTKCSAKLRKECSERLVILSALQRVLKHSIQDCDLRNSSAKDGKVFGNHNSHEMSHGIASSDWYQNTSTLFLENETIIKVLLWLSQSSCVFTSFLAKKVVLSYVCCKPVKINLLLQSIESLLAQDLDKNIGIFDLLLEFMSKRNFWDKGIIFEQTYIWFTCHFEDKHTLCLSNLESKSICRKDEWIKLMSYLSFLKKIIKYGNTHGKKANPSLLFCILDMLMNWTCENVHHEEKFYHPLIFKVIKILNVNLDLDFILKRDIITDSTLNMAVKILNVFPHLFTNLRKKYLSLNKFFWGNDKIDLTKEGKEQNSYNFNYNMARQFLMLSLKSCLFANQIFDDLEIKHSVYQIYENFKLWFIQEHKGEIESDWLPAFLGEDDEQWISVLLCLLLIHIHLSKEQKGDTPHQGQRQIFEDSPKNDDQRYQVNEKSAKCPTFEQSSSLSPKYDEHLTSTISNDPLCPHKLFMQFIEFIAFDHLVLADFLMSPETCFLAYFMKYITLLNDEWEVFLKIFNSIELEGKILSDQNKSNLKTKYLRQHVHSFRDQENTLPSSSHHNKDHSLLHDHGMTNQKSVNDTNMQAQIPKSALKSVKGTDDDLETEPPDKTMRLESTSMIPFHLSNQTLASVFDSRKVNHPLITPLVSYPDSEDSDSDNGSSDHKDVTKEKTLSLFQKYSNQVGEREIPSDRKNETSDDEGTILTNNKAETIANQTIMSSNTNSESSCDESESELSDIISEYSETNTLEKFMTMMIRLHFHIERLKDQCLISFNVHSLLKSLNVCVERYESAETMH